jgi:superfamily II DNA/RNA helicase
LLEFIDSIKDCIYNLAFNNLFIRRLTMKFSDIETISKGVLDYLSDNKIVDMTEIQRQTYKHIMDNRDIIACSSTGTGKTLAYLIPIINRLKSDTHNIQAVVLVPTAELAIQVNNTLKDIFAHIDNTFSSVALIGDVNISRQIDSIKSNKPAIIIGTPNRIHQLISNKKIKVHEVKTLVLDEADKLFDKTFIQDVEAIRKSLMKFTQVLLFSASVDKKTRTNTLCFKPIFIDINSNSGNTSQIPSTIKHISVISDRRERIETLRKIIKAVKPEKAIIFVNSKYDLEESLQKLEYHHYNVASIAGNKDNSAKKAAIENFRSGKIQLLIATDIAARGLQIDNIDTVINVNLPEDNKEYIHRCGRCGRNGNTGTCISIITDNELNKIKSYQKAFHINIVNKRLYQGKLVAK